jgi:hypothetical protein
MGRAYTMIVGKEEFIQDIGRKARWKETTGENKA